MSEALRTHEHGEQKYVDHEKAQERSKELAAERDRAAAEAEKHKDSPEAIRERIEAAHNKEHGKETAHSENAASESAVPLGGHQLSTHLTKRTLHKVQKQLAPSERAFSKVIHQPVVEAISDVGGATVGRPSGLFVGGLLSVISSLVVLYICRHYGYEYNFMIGLACFVGGFAAGLLLEAIYKLFKR